MVAKNMYGSQYRIMANKPVVFLIMYQNTSCKFSEQKTWSGKKGLLTFYHQGFCCFQIIVYST